MLSAKEIAQHYGVTRQAVEKWVKRGNIPYKLDIQIKKKPRKLYDMEALKNYLDNRVVYDKPV